MNANLKNEVAEAIEFVLCMGQMKLIGKKERTGDINEMDIKTEQKESCEMLEKILADKIKITDYEKFASMVKRCELALVLSAMANDTNMSKRMIGDMVENYIEGCTTASVLTA